MIYQAIFSLMSFESSKRERFLLCEEGRQDANSEVVVDEEADEDEYLRSLMCEVDPFRERWKDIWSRRREM